MQAHFRQDGCADGAHSCAVSAQQMHRTFQTVAADKYPVMRLVSLIVHSLSLCALLTGCGDFRGIPSHGGGKRFDEEQRVVAGTIRQTLADMDLHELTGKKVQIAVESISQDGGAMVSFPGVSAISAGISGNTGSGNLVQITPSGNGSA